MNYSIKMAENEYWWGGAADLGDQMPYDADTVKTVDLNTDGNDQRSPLYISSTGRYIKSSAPFKISFNKGEIFIESDCEVELKDGFGTLKGAHCAVAEKYFRKDGACPAVKFFEAPQYNTWIELMYNQNQKQILSYAHSIADNDMPAGILMIDEGWSEDYGVFDFYPGRFENPAEMIEELHSLGFTVMLWVTPHISPDSHAFRELRDTDYLIRDKDGNFAIREWWNGYSCVLDLSNPGAVSWFKNKLDGVMEKYKVDGFKFDAGDPYMYRDTDKTYVLQNGIENTKNYGGFAANYTFNELRAVWNMGGEPIVCRLQDKLHKWDEKGINLIIPNIITQGLLGYYFGCPDMVGGGDFGSFTDRNFKLDEELYVRWLEASLLCPMLQFSIAPKRVLSEENYQTVKKLVKLREKFIPYITELAENAAVNHEPIVRHMEYEFPHCGYAKTRDMFMLGSKYLVIPMMKKGGLTRMVRLPEGKWRELSGDIYEGEREYELKYPLDKLYVFERM